MVLMCEAVPTLTNLMNNTLCIYKPINGQLNIKNYSHPLHYVNVAIGLYSTSCHSPQYSLHVSSVNPFTSISLFQFPL